MISNQDIEILNKVIAVPLFAFGRSDFEKLIGKDFAMLLEKNINNLSKVIHLDKEKFIKSYVIAREILDPIECQTITGFSWNDTKKVLFKLLS